MKYLVVKDCRKLLEINEDLKSATAIESCGINKDWGWFINEDGIVLYDGVEHEVKKGDYVLTMYTPESNIKKFTIIRNADLYQNYLDFKEADSKHKEECKFCDESRSR